MKKGRILSGVRRCTRTLARMKVARGDKLHVVETPDGYLLTPSDPDVAEQVEAGREFVKEIREIFEFLAK